MGWPQTPVPAVRPFPTRSVGKVAPKATDGVATGTGASSRRMVAPSAGSRGHPLRQLRCHLPHAAHRGGTRLPPSRAPRHLYPRPHPHFPLAPQAPAINLLFANPPPSAPGVVCIPSPRDCEVATNGRRGEIGVGGVSTPSGPVLPGTMGEPILHPGSGEAPRVLPPEGLGGAGPAKPGALDDLLARRSQEAGRRQDLVANPGRVARLRSHFTPTTGSGTGASPCRRPAALLFDIAGWAGGRVRSPSI